MYCQQCGNEVTPGAKFCARCGAPVRTDGFGDALNKPSQTTPSPNAPSGDTYETNPLGRAVAGDEYGTNPLGGASEPTFNSRKTSSLATLVSSRTGTQEMPAQKQADSAQGRNASSTTPYSAQGRDTSATLPDGDQDYFASASSDGAGAAAAGMNRNTKVTIGVVCGIAAAILCVLFFTLVMPTIVPWQGGSAGSVGTLPTTQVAGRNGETIMALNRPRFVTVDLLQQDPNDVTKQVSPALVNYIGGTNATATSGDSSASSSGTTGSSSATDSANATANGSANSSGGGNSGNSGNSAPATEGATTTTPSPNQAPNTANEAVSPQSGATQNSGGATQANQPDTSSIVPVNKADFSLSDDLYAKLQQDLFVVDATNGDDEYFDLYEFNRYAMLPNFVTVDSIMHTYHLYFSYLLKSTESGYLYDKLGELSQTMLDTTTAQQAALAGSEFEDAARRTMIFFGVGLTLLNPGATVPDAIAGDVAAEVAKINAASEPSSTNAVTNEPEDYTQYKPRGYYEETEQLQRYFRTMMWYGRTHFLQAALNNSTSDNAVLNRCALLIVLAMRGDAPQTPNKNWETIYTVTNFFAGASDDCGFYEYYPLVEAAYGADVTVESLPGNTEGWDYFNELTANLEPPKVGSVIVGDETEVSADDIKGFRFMGQRFSIDAAIYTQLVHDRVQERTLPSALDIPAAFGSNEALTILGDEGKTDYPGYDSQMEKVRTEIANSDLSLWTSDLYSLWLYTLTPVLGQKADACPAFMQSTQWTKKDLQTFLASYAELKHDTVLYTKQVMVEMGGGPIDNDDRGYVEPEPELYRRLAELVRETSDGLARYGILSDVDKDNLSTLETLVTSLETIANKELAGENLTDDEFELIRSYGGQLEHFWDSVNPSLADGGPMKANSSPAALVTDVASDETQALELGTGKIAEIYVIAPVAGQWKICSGGVPMYYEFAWPKTDRLTDSSWRTMMGIPAGSKKAANAPDPVEWSDSYTFVDPRYAY